MTGVDRLTDMLRLCAMRRRLAQQHLQSAAERERQRADIAEEGRKRQHEAEREAEDYVSLRFAAADLSHGAAGFFASLALGHRRAERAAFSLATRAERLAERHLEAVDDRQQAGRQLLRSEQRLTQRAGLVDDAVSEARADQDEAEEEEGQDIRAGRGINGSS
jgi:hypothetical protein